MTVIAIVVVVVVAACVVAFFLMPGRGPLNSFERASDQHNKASGFGKPLEFQGDLTKPRDEQEVL